MVARLGMRFSASSYQDECGVCSGNLFNAMLTRNMRKSSWQYFIVRGCSNDNNDNTDSDKYMNNDDTNDAYNNYNINDNNSRNYNKGTIIVTIVLFVIIVLFYHYYYY